MVVVKWSFNGAHTLQPWTAQSQNIATSPPALIPHQTRFRTSIPVTRIFYHDDLVAIVKDEAASLIEASNDEGSLGR